MSTKRSRPEKERVPHPPSGQFSQRRGIRDSATGEFRAENGSRLSAQKVREGLPLQALDDLAAQLNVERATLAQILGTSVRTLQRKTEEGERLGPAASDRLARITRILNLAAHVFGESAKASIWLVSKSRALDGEVPLQMLDTDIGTERVQQELRQIEYGMPF